MGEDDDEPLAIQLLADAYGVGLGYAFALVKPDGKVERIDPAKVFADVKMPEGYAARREALKGKR